MLNLANLQHICHRWYSHKVEKLLEEFGLTRRIKLSLLADSPLAESHKSLHPYKTAVFTMLGKTPEILGYCGEIHPELKSKLKINQDAFLIKYEQLLLKDNEMIFGTIF